MARRRDGLADGARTGAGTALGKEGAVPDFVEVAKAERGRQSRSESGLDATHPAQPRLDGGRQGLVLARRRATLRPAHRLRPLARMFHHGEGSRGS